MTEEHFYLQMLKSYSAKNLTAEIDFGRFFFFLQKIAQKQPDFKGTQALLAENAMETVSKGLTDLEEKKLCTLVYSGDTIRTIHFPLYYSSRVAALYKTITESPETPFPSGERSNLSIPANFLTTLNVKEDFTNLLSETSTEDTGKIYRFSFPEEIDSMIVPEDMVQTRLLELALQKIRLYLNTAKNAEYVRNKLAGIFRQREQLLKEMFSSVLTQNRLSMDSILNPTDFTYLFWTHTASAVISEFRQKKEKLILEHSFCQAAYLIGLFALYYKGITQKKKEKETAYRSLEQSLKKEPFCFTFDDIARFEDAQGMLLTRKLSQSEIFSFIQKLTTEVQQGDLPEIIHIKGSGSHDYFVYKDKLLPLTLRKIIAASQEYRQHFIELFHKDLEKFRKTEEMVSDTAFSKAIEKHLEKEDPLLHSLLKFELLYLTLKDTKPGIEILRETERCLDLGKQALLPLNIIFRLDRKILLGKAKRLLPLWKTIPILKFLVKLFSAREAPKKAKKETSAEGSSGKTAGREFSEENQFSVSTRKVYQDPEKTATKSSGGGNIKPKEDPMIAYKKAIGQLKAQFLGKDASMEKSLSEYAEKWNPLFDPKAKANLVEDVNSLVRDYLRTMKKSFIKNPPDAKRIENLARTLAENRLLEKIKKKDYLRKYIELYMIKYLS